jgi:hypothetical protein
MRLQRLFNFQLGGTIMTWDRLLLDTLADLCGTAALVLRLFAHNMRNPQQHVILVSPPMLALLPPRRYDNMIYAAGVH